MINILFLMLFAALHIPLFSINIVRVNNGILHIGDTYNCEGSMSLINGEVQCSGRLYKNGKLVSRSADASEKPAQVVKRNHSLRLGRNYSLSVDNKSRGSYEIPDGFTPGIEIRGHDSDSTEIEVSILSDNPEKVLSKIDQGSNSLSISTQYADTTASGLVGYSLKVPEEVNTTFIKTNIGRILIENLAKEVGDVSAGSGKIIIKNVRDKIRKVSTLSGRITLENIHGSVDAKTTSGTIDCSRINGLAHLRSLSGDIKVYNIESDAIVNTTSGNITLRNIKEDAAITTVSGDISCSEVGGSAKLSSTSGSIYSDAIAKQLIARTISGAISHRIDKFQKSIKAYTVSGRCYFNGKFHGKFFALSNNEPSAQFSTTSGDIHIN